MTRQAETVKPKKLSMKSRAGKAGSRTTKSASTHPSQGNPQGSSSADSGESVADSRHGIRTEQLGAALAKGLDLAEASLNLGLTLVTRFGSIVQQSVLDKMADNLSAPNQEASNPETQQPKEAAAPASASADEFGAAPPHDLRYSITNRLPLSPGQAVRVSFSLNNDSGDVAKRVKLRVEGFIGQISTVQFPGGGFSVKPVSSAIAPMDFEKFVLRGMLPPDIPSDVYLGKVVVLSEQDLEIPVRLVVGPPVP